MTQLMKFSEKQWTVNAGNIFAMSLKGIRNMSGTSYVFSQSSSNLRPLALDALLLMYLFFIR